MTKYILSVLLFFVSIANSFAQTDYMQNAIEKYSQKQFVEAINQFSLVDVSKLTSDEKMWLLFYKGKSFVEINEKQAAIFTFEEFLKEVPISSLTDEVIYLLGKQYFEVESFDLALKLFQKYVTDYKFGKNFGSGLFWAAKSAEKLQLYEQVENYYLDAISMSATNDFLVESIYSIAILYEEMERFEEAITYFDQLLSFYRDSKFAPFAQLRIGKNYFYANEFDTAILELTDPLIFKLPEDKQIEAKYFQANSYFRMKEYNKSIEIYQDLLRSFPNQEQTNQIRFNQAWTNFQSGMFEESYRIFNLLSKLAEGEIAVESMFWAAESKRFLGETELAEIIYNQFIKLNSNSNLIGEVYFVLGLTNYEKGDIPKAESFLKEAISSKNDEAKAKSYLLLAQMELEKLNYAKAENLFKMALQFPKITKNTIQGAKFGLGVTFFYRGEFEKAKVEFETIYKSDKKFESDKIHYYLGETFFKMKNFIPALEHFSAVNFRNSEVGEKSLFGKAYCSFYLHKYADAIYYFLDFLKQFPHSQSFSEANLRLADSYFGIQNYKQASGVYANIFQTDKAKDADDLGYFQYAKTMFKLGKSAESIRVFRLLQEKFPKSVFAEQSQFLIGWINFQEELFPQAITNYEYVLENYPNGNLRSITFLSIGDAYLKQQDYQSAVVFYKRLLDEFPNSEHILSGINAIQLANFKQNQSESTIYVINSFLSKNPNSIYAEQILIKKGEIYLENEDFEKAQSVFKEFVSTYPKSKFVANAYLWLAKCELKLERTEIANFYFDMILKDFPNSEIAIQTAIEYGIFNFELQNFNKSVEIYDKILVSQEASENLAELYYLKGLSLIELGKIEEVYNTFNQLLIKNPESIFADKAKLELGILEFSRKSYEVAEDVFREISNRRTDEIGVKSQFLLGEVLFEENRNSEAISAFVRLQTVFPKEKDWVAKSQLKLGDIYLKMKDKKKAKEMYQIVYNSNKNNEFGNEASKKLKGIK